VTEVYQSSSLWIAIQQQAHEASSEDGVFAHFLEKQVLTQRSLGGALSLILARKLTSEFAPLPMLIHQFEHAFSTQPIQDALWADLLAITERDPACKSALEGLLFYKGFHAIGGYRLAHWLWNRGKQGFARLIQSQISEIFGVDIHPAARLGQGLFIDHATGVVIGETAVMGDNCSLLHGVTLGGTGKEIGDRHPKISHNVLIGAGAKILGNITIGEHARIAASSVVLYPVDPYTTVAGIPAKPVSTQTLADFARTMNHVFDV
jgi:serine O-acetyltransferase